MPSVITGKQGKSQRMRNDRKRGGSVAQPEAKEHWQTLETGKEKKKKDSPLEPPEGYQPC